MKIITIPPLLLYILCLSRNATYVLHITRELINPSAENYSTFSPFLQKFEVFFKHSDKDELVCDVLKRKKNIVVSKLIMYYFAFRFYVSNNI